MNLVSLLKQIDYSRQFHNHNDNKNKFVRCLSEEYAQHIFMVTFLLAFYAAFNKEQFLKDANHHLENNSHINPYFKSKLLHSIHVQEKNHQTFKKLNDLTAFNKIIDNGDIKEHFKKVLSQDVPKQYESKEQYFLMRNIKQEQRLARNLLRFLKFVKKDIHRQISIIQNS